MPTLTAKSLSTWITRPKNALRLWAWSVFGATVALSCYEVLAAHGESAMQWRFAIMLLVWVGALGLLGVAYRAHTLAASFAAGARAAWWNVVWGSALWWFITLVMVPTTRFRWRWPAFHTFWGHLLPLWGWGALVAVGAVFYSLALRKKQLVRPKIIWAPMWRRILIGEGLLAALVLLQGWGWRPPFALYWQGAGIPLLWSDVWFAVSGSGAVLWLGARWARPFAAKRYRGKIWRRLRRHRGKLLLAAIWGVTLGLWLWAHPADSYFLSLPYPPNDVAYPLSDAANWDASAWQGVLGYGYAAKLPLMNRGAPYQHHQGYFGLLALLHLILPSFSLFMWGYVALMALSSVLLYKLGAVLHSRWAGILLAILNMALEMRKITGAQWAVTAHARQLMTEPALRLLLIAVALIFALWTQKPWRYRWMLPAVGAFVGIGSLFRAEAYLLLGLPAAFVLMSEDAPGAWKQALGRKMRYAALFFAGIAGIYLPWMGRAAVLSNHLSGAQQNSPWFFWWSIHPGLQPEFRGNYVAPQSSLPYNLQESGQISEARVLSDLPFPLDEKRQQQIQAIAHWWVLNNEHLLLLLPATMQFYALPDVVRHAAPYWERIEGRKWFEVYGQNAVMLLLNLLVVSVGLAVLSVKKSGKRFVILMGFIVAAYTLGLAGAREAGGRYGVPVDWAFPLLYMIGWAEIGRLTFRWWGQDETGWFLRREQTGIRWIAWAKWGMLGLAWSMVLVEFAAIGWVAYADQGSPTRWAQPQIQDVLHRLDAWQAWDALPWERDDLQRALVQGEVQFQWGYLLYPRSVLPGMACGDLCEHIAVDIPVTYFNMISASGRLSLRLQGEAFAKAVDMPVEAIVLYCPPEGSRRLEALLLVWKPSDGETSVLFRESPPPLQCPLSP